MHGNKIARGSRAVALATALALLGADAGWAAGTPEQKCEAAKNKAVGKYAACVEKAEAGLILSGDGAAYSAAVFKCDGKLFAAWGKAEAAAAAAGSACLTVGDRPAIDGFTDTCIASVAEALSGGTLLLDPLTCSADLATCDADEAACSIDAATCLDDLADVTADLAQCDAAIAVCEAVLVGPLKTTGQTNCYDDGGLAIACAGSGQDAEFQASVAPSYTDNGDGTITDNVTGLMWEKLSRDGSVHDYDVTYASPTAAIAKATALNSAVFAGHNDWRLPNRTELESLLNLANFGTAVHPAFQSACIAGCTVLNCSCTKGNIYWTSSSYFPVPTHQWVINFTDGDVYAQPKTGNAFRARAVRTAD